jgi:hypothetical protein
MALANWHILVATILGSEFTFSTHLSAKTNILVATILGSEFTFSTHLTAKTNILVPTILGSGFISDGKPKSSDGDDLCS